MKVTSKTKSERVRLETHLSMIIPAKDRRPEPKNLYIDRPEGRNVTIQLHASALNFADLLMAKGSYQETPAYPFVPGLEGAGIVLEAGPDAKLREGGRVAVFSQGTMQEVGNFPEDACIPIPDSMSFEDAAAFQIAYGTSHLALTKRADLQPGETLVVLGAAGGVGLTAVEIGAALGARVVAIARGKDKLAAAKEAGATILIDSDEVPDLKAELKRIGGADVIYDPVGGKSGTAAFAALNRGGRFLLIGFAGGNIPDLPLNHALVKNIAIHGLYWGGYRTLSPEVLRDSMTQLFQMVADGRLKPRPAMSMPLSELAKAYDLLETRRSIGKIVVTM